jgi:hypothetical protein
MNLDNVKVIEFVPRKRNANDCKCENKEVVMRGGRIEYVKCFDCGQEVWS